MSQYKSSARPQQDSSPSSKYPQKAAQLQELFPAWTNDDLLSLLAEVNGDVELAATRISEGHVEVWGEVSRKKDKKAPVPTHSSKPIAVRGDSRAARGGRGGRGGLAGRGGPAVSRGRGGIPRGSASTNGHARPDSSKNGAAPALNQSAANDAATPATSVDPSGSQETPAAATNDQQHGLTPSNSGWTEASTQGENSTVATSVSANGSAWGSTAAPSTASDANGHATNGPSSSAKQSIKNPATSKLSWAQIARPQEKPAPVAPAPPAPVQTTPAAVPTSAPAPAPVPSTTENETTAQPNGWEEPTTVENPTWEEEPQQPKAPEAWPAATEPPSEPASSEPAQSPVVEPKPEIVEEKAPPEPEPVPEVKSELKPVSPLPATAQAASVLAEPAATATPSPKLNRPAVGFNRSAVRHKIPDQPVTLPISFGSGIEKVGMQFGSLGLSDDSTTKEPEAPTASTATVTEPPAPVVSQPKPQPEAAPSPPSAPPATAPAASSSLTSMFGQQQQSVPQVAPLQPPVQALPAQPTLTHHSIPTSVSQPNPTTQAPPTVAAVSPLPQYPQQTSAVPQQVQQTQPSSVTASHPPHHQPPHQAQQQQQHLQHLPQQLQNHAAHHSYSQHGLQSHIDPAQPTQTAAQHQSLQSATHSNYFRQTDSTGPYFHTPTPPSAQAQDNQYGSFGQLGGQAQHQQSSHLGGFNASDYSYGDTPRGFYDTYTQQTAFASRNPLTHDDAKTLPGSQPPSATNLPPSATQGVQPHTSQPSAQPQSAGGQAPPQNYAPPVPSLPNYYYNPHAYQNQYYNSPYQSAGYIPQPFVKYPAMFQPGPPGGPGSAANPTNKQPSANVGVQPQTNPYSQGLYQQAGYDDYSHTHHSQHQHSHSLGLGQGGVGVGSGEYGKQLYGGAGQGGMQGFMGLSGQTSAGGNGPSNNTGPRASNSPESAYKPYASKDVGVASNRNAPPQNGPQGQPQGQGQAQGNHNHNQVPQGQGFYGSNRFGGGGIGGANTGGVGSSVGGPQQNAHTGPQGHLAYPQGATEPGFYGYQPRQQGYWQ